jgi:hypothetical protein
LSSADEGFPANLVLAFFVDNSTAFTRNRIITLSKMARKKPRQTVGEETLMFPSLHQNIVEAVSDENISTWFHKNDSDEGSNNLHTTQVMGKFKCNNNACSKKGWSSKKVAISIRGYPTNGYNAVVFNQRCKACELLGTLTLDIQSYVDRVAYRLKKWAGVATEK